MILDCEVDFEFPIILERAFLVTRRAFVGVECGELQFKLNDKEIVFNVCKYIKKPRDMSVISMIDIIDDVVDASVEEKFTIETLAAMIKSLDFEEVDNYEETINALYGRGSYLYAPKKLDLDLKNRETPPAKPSIEQSSVLELKPFPLHL